ncbi:hypothetical protein [Bacillus sp. 1P02SD]|uniref:hypothetical protein n=1 Tax=Bacillus sp. 1P02SD TaxID=3132264 RepID=UPI0039A1C329
MGYKLIPARENPVPIPEDWQRKHLIKMYSQYKEKSKDLHKSPTIQGMYNDYAFGYQQALIALGYEIVEEN